MNKTINICTQYHHKSFLYFLKQPSVWDHWTGVVIIKYQTPRYVNHNSNLILHTKSVGIHSQTMSNANGSHFNTFRSINPFSTFSSFGRFWDKAKHCRSHEFVNIKYQWLHCNAMFYSFDHWSNKWGFLRVTSQREFSFKWSHGSACLQRLPWSLLVAIKLNLHCIDMDRQWNSNLLMYIYRQLHTKV